MFCDPLPLPSKFGYYFPSNCTENKSAYSAVCYFICPDGFVVKGPTHKTCQGRRTGTWSNRKKKSSCIGK